ncbi:ABC transporter ATP-binding protein [Plantactinospora mayteni]|uniref:ABC transporter ATP-binding protein n=1 Tax=Plantactinospora mayteni TaxID=566021 RepID=UPI0019437DF2|nr:ABC transporter ATP-binding protein [Plantactinospora mayteni]
MRVRLLLLRRLADAGLPVVAALATTLLVQALLPAATAVATAAVVSAMRREGEDPGALSHLATPLALLGAALLVNVALKALLRPLATLTKIRIDGAHRLRVARLAMGAGTIDTLEQPRTQDLLRQVTREPSVWLEKSISDGVLGQLRTVVQYLGLAATAAVLASFAWWLVLVLGVPAVAVRLLAIRRWRRHFRIWSAGLPDHRSAGYWTEVSTAPAEGKEVRVFGFADWLVGRQQRHVRTHLGPVWADDRRAGLGQWLPTVLMFVPLAAVYVIVARGVVNGAATVATEVAILTAAWSVYATLISLDDVVNVAGAAPVVEAYEELAERLGAVSRPAPAVLGPPVAASTGATAPPVLRFEKVVFRYPGADRPVLDGLDLEIRPGEWLAVVGLNGAGKSTLVKLLAGLYRPVAGRVTADGVDIHDPVAGGPAAWRRRLTVVFQDFVRYQLAAVDNVTFGAPGPVDAVALEKAVTRSGLAPVLERLPRGADTPLSRTRSGGVDLSGGQWQHVILARACYAVHTGARVLVLDEPTAHLDVRTESEVFDRLSGTRNGATTVLISHRLSTVRGADRIVLLADGVIAESGTHEELTAAGGRYARLFKIQADRFVQGYDDRLEGSTLDGESR